MKKSSLRNKGTKESGKTMDEILKEVMKTMNEIFKIPKLLRQGKTDDVIEIMQKYNIDTVTLIQLLARGYQLGTCQQFITKF